MTDFSMNKAGPNATLAQTRDLLRQHVHALWANPARSGAIPPLMLWGPPGIGKSAIVRGVCEDEGIGFVDVRLAQREPVDMRGLPVPRGDAVDWLPSGEWPRDPQSRGIIFFDELTSADRMLQASAYEFILDRRLGDLYTVPSGWYICAAGNRGGDAAVTVSLSSALANRFCHLEVMPDLESWVTWARGAGVRPEVIAFLRFRPECFFDMKGDLERGWPSPRSWERVGLALNMYEAHGDEDLLRLAVAGLVGPGAGTEFMAFRHWAGKLPNVLAMLRRQVRVQIPGRADQRYALCAAMVHHLWCRDLEAERARLLEGFFDIGEALSSDFAALAMADALDAADPQLAGERAEMIMQHPRFEQWTARHGAAFAQLWENAA